jgi:hypothetical protein
MATPIVWADTDLNLDRDLIEYETDAVTWFGAQGSGAKWRSTAKNTIAQRLRQNLKSIEVQTDASEVLDLIGNPEVLKPAACFLTLHLIAFDRLTSTGDLWDRKAEVYYAKFEAEMATALALLELDLDESGTIEDSEKYAAPRGVTFKHGG